MTTDPNKVSSEEIAQYRAELADNPDLLKDLELIETCQGDLEYSAMRLARRAGLSEVREGEENLWQVAIKEARRIVCKDEIKDDLAPNIIGGLYTLLIATSNPILAAIATPLAIYIAKKTLEEFCLY